MKDIMDLGHQFAAKMNEYIEQAAAMLKNLSKKELTPYSINFILVSKPLIQTMIDLKPTSNEWAQVYNDLSNMLSSKKTSEKITEKLQTKINKVKELIKENYDQDLSKIITIVYSTELNEVVNFVYDTLCYHNGVKNEYQDYDWF